MLLGGGKGGLGLGVVVCGVVRGGVEFVGAGAGAGAWNMW